jgi:hypothetical protein
MFSVRKYNVQSLDSYFCSTPAEKAEFTSDPDAKISKADSNWLKLGPATYNSEEHSFDEPWPFGRESNPQ